MPTLSLPRLCRLLLPYALVALCLTSAAAWAQSQDPSGEGGWQGLARVLEAATPAVDTSPPPSAADITQNIARLLDQGLYPEALQAIAARQTELDAANTPGTDVQLMFLHARALAAVDRHDEAVAIYRSMTERYPELPEPWNNLAAEYLRQQQLERAQEALQMALATNPDYALARANLGTVQLLLAQQSLQDAARAGDASARAQLKTIERLLAHDSPSSTSTQGTPLMHSKPQVILHTNQGDIRIELDAEKAPKTVENFLAYVQDGFYDGTIFHRVINNFMIQGGGFDSRMQQKDTRAPIQNEADNGLKNEHYTLAMARTNDPHSATAQFFINVSDNVFLDFTAPNANGWGYAVFGKVIEGMDVVDSIKGVKTGRSGFHQDVPLDAIVIEKATLVE